jgi:hypothetical protein
LYQSRLVDLSTAMDLSFPIFEIVIQELEEGDQVF